ncbi:hypothetical protein DES47_102278 [Roseateles toxinivorans]|uniref:Uncharacterized protein n=1 Tax=Roseateles toxinivorans TaxID=270368 RepID=A0A4R6QPD3_9BURK|nr:hypothetical protein DES47_102278 [Roseateles toxinivorans]
MRPSVIALLCGLAVAAALLVWRGGGDPPQEAAPAAVAPAVTDTPLVSPQPLQGPAPTVQTPNAASAAATAAVPAAMIKPPPRPTNQAGPARSAFALSSDHQTLIHETVLAAADHERLEQEPRDDAWATEAERQIRQALARHARTGDFDVVAVDCRQTLCAIQAFSYGENGHREWVKAVDELYKETLADLFDSVNTAFPTRGSRSPVLTFLHRKPVAARP